MATVTIDLPDEIAQRLRDGGWHDLSRHTLESVALETYRQEYLTRRQSGGLLGYSFWETEVFMKDHDAYIHYDFNDFLQDMETNKRFMERQEKEMQISLQ